MIILDTDHITLLVHSGIKASHLIQRLSGIDPREVATTIISYEEQTRGWMSVVAEARSLEAQVEAYDRLIRHLHNYCQTPVLPFDQPAAAEFHRLRQCRVRIGTMDLKIAAIARVREATLLSGNLRDFRKVPDLDVQDWTSEPS